MKTLPWFRLYTEMIDDEKLGLLAFEDRWHFVALLCLKGKGVLDSETDADMLQRKVALKMGLTVAELEKVVSRLARMGLIDKETFQPLAWDARQMQSDSSAERVRAYRERQKQGKKEAKRDGNVTVTAQDTDTDTDKEEEKKEDKRVSAPLIPADLLSDFLSVRKAKRAGPLTNTALAGIAREADKAGISLADAIAYCCEAGWQGFNAGWYAERNGKKPRDAPRNKFSAAAATIFGNQPEVIDA